MKDAKLTGLKLTPQRLAILEYLSGNREHPSAADIYAAVSEKFPTMSFATVYNTLKALRDRDHVLELAIDGGKRRYDPETIRHHHLICTECRKIVDIYVEFDLSVPEAERDGFDIAGNHVDFYGVCRNCRESGSEQKAASRKGRKT
ncbi:MAG: Transcriptional regulator PerR [Syntrophus sp. PtaU1.Bin005]|jgi:Fur family peroxide stress response transcriptional regulator|uniref:Fur family transcriptional regulator n=1 Tax=Syntrophus TaxID=43773 RepID=UPI0009D159BF|nr:MAG: Transcriptional regulator PerR [Syntrophus sp. PtaB.Bin138]OPY80507.1 MAG: Transcriptional regulator PerR [Syntrophus sp. PtaU1.Bin005]